MGTTIKANTILPANREAITLHTADGLELVGELARPQGGPPVATLVCLHPLPTHGGMMDSHLLRKAAWRLPALAGIAVLRLNTRGTESAAGRSGGSFDGGGGELYDVAAALEYADFHDLPQVWLLGWSFGSELVLMHGCDPLVRGAILVSPPLRLATGDHLSAWARSGKPVACLVPEFDDYLRPDGARSRFAAIPQAEIVTMVGAKHLLVGYADEVLDEVVSRIAPAVPTPLPGSWDGSFDEADQ